MGVCINQGHYLTIRGKGDLPSPMLEPTSNRPRLVSDSGMALAPKIFYMVLVFSGITGFRSWDPIRSISAESARVVAAEPR